MSGVGGSRTRTRRPDPSGRRTPGETGVWVFVLGDMLAFAVVFGVLVVTQADDPGTYERSQSRLHIELGIVNTLVLLTSSLAVALAVRAAHGPDPREAVRPFCVALGCAAVFVACEAVEYADLLSDGVGARTNDFFTCYFASTGLHLVHVLIGGVVLVGVVRIARRPRLEPRDLVAIENGTTYWHMVDLLWIVLFALLYLLG